ncbi:RNA polymerase II holoenzyme cyclin-like subunit [Meyerozyma sp. JA9]|nr:RNA polymerase II holoenzyme cyclin-like subunit [Meyerozyma sp. JA9]
MSANYWSSSQRTVWQHTRQSLADCRRRLLVLEKKMIQNGFIKDYPHITYSSHVRIYLHNLLCKLGRRLNIRQVALASAEVFLSRFLIRVSLKEINVYLLATTCLYVACKSEECPQHIRLIISEARNLWPEYIPHDVTKLAEFEFYLIEEMDSYLVLHHPYKSLLQIQQYLSDNFATYKFALSEQDLQHAWSIINDSYVTDVHLVYPPHIVAVACIYITVVLRRHASAGDSTGAGDLTAMHIDDLAEMSVVASSGDNFSFDHDVNRAAKLTNFINHSHMNLEEIVDVVEDILNMYVLWNRYNEANWKKAFQDMLLGSVPR